MGDYQAACARALTFLSCKREPEISELLKRIAWELLSVAPNGVADLALITQPVDGPSLICGARERLVMPREIVSELVIERRVRGDLPLVRDHLINGSRLTEGSPRTSVVVRFVADRSFAPDGFLYIWVGLSAVATSALVAEVESLTEDLGRWFQNYSATVQSIIQKGDQIIEVEARERELLSALHDLRAPLSGIRSLLDLSGRSRISRSVSIPHDSLEVIAGQMDYLEGILASLGPLGESGRDVRIVRCDVNQVLRRVVERMKMASSEKGTQLCLKLSEDALVAAIPEIELERAISNVLGNALQYAHSAEVVAFAYSQGAKACVRICDRGPGISPEILSRLCEHQAQSVSGCRGWGIGLLSTRRRIEAFQGDLSISSSSGGTIVDLSVPRVMLSMAELTGPVVGVPWGAERVSDRVSPKLLLIDDEEEQISSLQSVLGVYGISAQGCTSVHGAIEALSLVKPEAILCDATMADGGAIELLNQISSRGITARVAVASGDSSEGLLYRCAALGAQEFFSKPIDIAKLMQWIGCEDAEANAPTQVL